jgi:hypothetical protein
MFWSRKRKPIRNDDILRLSHGDGDWLTLEQCFNNVFIFGQVGSGKTTGPLAHLALGLLKHPSKPGALILCQKPDEGKRWLGYAKKAGRLDDVMHVVPGGPWKLDIIDHEMNVVGIEAVAELFRTMQEASERGKATNMGERYWPDQAARYIRFAATLISFAGYACGIHELLQFFQSVPSNPEQLKDARWRAESYACKCLLAASSHKDDPSFQLAGEWFLKEFPELSDKTRSNIMSIVLSTLDRLYTSKFASLICEDTTWRPDEVVRDGKILILDVPGAVYGVAAQLASIGVKTLFQRAVLRRPLDGNPKPFIIHADEGANFAVNDLDSNFLSQSRQFRCICINAVQNLPLVTASLGASESARIQASAWISNHGTILGCANSDPETNKLLSAMAGEEKELMFGGSSGPSQNYDFVGDFMGEQQGHAHASWNEQYRPALPPEAFMHLRKGSKQNAFQVQAFVFQSGRRFANGRTFTLGSWEQVL